MAEKYFPFNSVSGDREYYAEDFAAYFGDIISSGVSANGDNLGVTAAGGLALSVGTGRAWIKGHIYENTTTKTLTISAGGSLPRIDRVVTRLMVAERKIETIVVEGTPNASPEPPELMRTSDYWDICLAEVYVAASAIEVSQTDITDTRTDNDVCGVVRCAVDNLDVGAFMKASEAAFDAWLAHLKNMLDDNQAGNLQNQIDAIRNDLDGGVYSTTAIVNVRTVPGATVKMILGGIELVATADSFGLAILYPTKLGAYAATATTSNDTYVGSLDIDSIKIYNISLPGLAAMSWADIAEIGQAGAAPYVFQRGETKDVLMGSETITFRLEDFDHDDLASGGKAAMTFLMKDLLSATQRMNSSDTNVGSWNSSEMRTSRMPTYLSQLPAELRAVIKPVIKKTTAGNKQTTVQTTTDSLWLPSCVEVGLHTTEDGYKDEGTTYPLFVDNASRIKKLSNGAGAANYYWLRSPSLGNTANFRRVSTDGTSYGNAASDSNGVCLGFCV